MSCGLLEETLTEAFDLSNLVFSRRAIQRLILELQKVLTASQLEGIVDRLNNTDRLATMWEIVFLSALARIGTLRHEVPLSNGSRPDFEVNDLGTTMVGDITTVSNAGRHTANLVHYLDGEIRRKKTLIKP